jgi:hypothetical protein
VVQYLNALIQHATQDNNRLKKELYKKKMDALFVMQEPNQKDIHHYAQQLLAEQDKETKQKEQ